eukprot:619614-Prymnesium_polylepis.1
MLTLLPKSSRSDSADGAAIDAASITGAHTETIALSIITRDVILTLECEPGLSREAPRRTPPAEHAQNVRLIVTRLMREHQ